MEEIGISVIVAVYNMESYLRECLDSVFDQSFQNFELILVNDGSTDSSEDIIFDYIKKHKNQIVYLKKENGGISSARNMAIENAKGKYITFLDADDYILKDYLEILFNAAEKNNSEMVVSGQYKVNKDGTIIDQILYHPDDKGNSLLRRLNISGKLYRRDFVEKQKIRFPLGKTYEDNVFNLTAYFLSKNLFFLEYAGYYQLIHEGSITSKKIRYDALPIRELEEAVEQVMSNLNLVQDEKLFEFTVLSFFTYFIFVRNKKKEYLDTGDRQSNIQEVVRICDDFQRITRKHFPKYCNNPYFNLFKYKELQLTQKAGSLAFALLVRSNLLKPFVKVYYRL